MLGFHHEEHAVDMVGIRPADVLDGQAVDDAAAPASAASTDNPDATPIAATKPSLNSVGDA